MGQSGSSKSVSDFLGLLAAFVKVFGVSSLLFAGGIVFANPWVAGGLVVVYLGGMFLAGQVQQIWYYLASDFHKGVAKCIKGALSGRMHRRYQKSYLEYLYFRHRNFDIKGLTTQGPHSLELEKVFVNLTIWPDPTPSSDPIQRVFDRRGRSVWWYLGQDDLNHLAIIGPPGCGKTTLVKYITLTLAQGNTNQRKKLSQTLPVLLFLRNHAQRIEVEPSVRLVDLIHDSLDFLDEEVPDRWFEAHLKNGNCLVMLDGVDEVGDPPLRRKVVAWVDAQAKAHYRNQFVVTSRPYGYTSNPIDGFDLLEVNPFSRKQVKKFVTNWYLANEIKAHGDHDPGVEIEARQQSRDLLRRIYQSPDISELAVNPLLLTMIANVHRFSSALPGRRVELYAEMCRVFLGLREANRENLPEDYLVLTPAQKQQVLQPLAYNMMHNKQREIEPVKAAAIIAPQLGRVTATLNETKFLELIQNRSGILVERESGVYGFSHKSFQEYLAATHIQKMGMVDELITYIEDDWWNETIRLYCAQEDASPIISACLDTNPQPVSVLVLAIECLEESLEVQPAIRERLERILDDDLESDDPERWRAAASAQLTLRLKRLTRIDDIFIDSDLITKAEYQLFIDSINDKIFTPHHWSTQRFSVGQAGSPIKGITSDQAQGFCDWLTARDLSGEYVYRLPKSEEWSEPGPYWIHEGDRVVLNLPSEETIPFTAYILAEDERENNLSWEGVSCSYFNIDSLVAMMAQQFYFSSDRDLASDLDRDLASDLDRDLASARDIARNLSRRLASELDNERARARNSERARTLARASASASELDRTLDRTLARDSASASERALARTIERARELASASARELARDRELDSELDSVNELNRTLNRTSKLGSTLDNALASASDLDSDSELDHSLVHASDLASTLARTLNHTRDRALNNASASELARILNRNSELASALASTLTSASDLDSDSELVKLFQTVSKILWGYVHLIITQLEFARGTLLLFNLENSHSLDSYRKFLLSLAIELNQNQPTHRRFGSNEEWEHWHAQINNIQNAYAALALLERRSRGEVEAIECLRIVRERTKSDEQLPSSSEMFEN